MKKYIAIITIIILAIISLCLYKPIKEYRQSIKQEEFNTGQKQRIAQFAQQYNAIDYDDMFEKIYHSDYTVELQQLYMGKNIYHLMSRFNDIVVKDGRYIATYSDLLLPLADTYFEFEVPTEQYDKLSKYNFDFDGTVYKITDITTDSDKTIIKCKILDFFIDPEILRLKKST